MRKMSVVRIVSLFLISLVVRAQRIESIPPEPLELTYYKTTNILFPYSIKSVDRGSRDILVQRAKGAENVLHLKAGRQGFRETSLTVITADGRLYSFRVNYAINPRILNLDIQDEGPSECKIRFSSGLENQAEVRYNAALATGYQGKGHHGRDAKYGVSMKLNKLFVQNNMFYFLMELGNKSNIDYNVDQLRVYIKDQKNARRTATQELELKPVYINGDVDRMLGKTNQTIVLVLPKFTIPDKKDFIIQLMEENGGRHLHLKIGNKVLVRAAALESLYEPN